MNSEATPRYASNRDRTVATTAHSNTDLRRPPTKGKLPSRSSLPSIGRRSLGAVEVLAETRRIQAEKRKRPRPDQYAIEPSPERQTSRRKTANGRLAAPPLKSRPSIDPDTLIALQLGQDPPGKETQSLSGKPDSEATRGTRSGIRGIAESGDARYRDYFPDPVAGRPSAENHAATTVRQEEEEDGDDATGGAEQSRKEGEQQRADDQAVDLAHSDVQSKKKRGRGRPRLAKTSDHEQPTPAVATQRVGVSTADPGQPLRRSPRKPQQLLSPQMPVQHSTTSSRKRRDVIEQAEQPSEAIQEHLLDTPPSRQAPFFEQSASVSPGARSSPAVVIASTGDPTKDDRMESEQEEPLSSEEEPESGSLGQPKTVANDQGFRSNGDADYEDANAGDGEEDALMLDDDEEDQEESDEGNTRNQMQQKTKSQQTGSPNRANTSRRLQSSAVGDASPEEPAEDSHRLYGEWPTLRKIVRAAERRLENSSYVSNDNAVNNSVKACKRKTRQLQNLRKSLETKGEDPSRDSVEGLEDVLAELKASVQELCDGSRITGQSDLYERTTAVCELLFPLTVKLLDAVVCLHEVLDVDVRGESKLTLEHLEIVVHWMRTVSNLGKTVRDNLRADPKHAVKLDLHVKIVIPLRKMTTSLDNQHADMVAEQQRIAQREREMRMCEADLVEQEVLHRRKQHLKRLVHKWNSLHLVRQSVIPNFLLVSDRATRKHLAYPQDKIDLYVSDDNYLVDRVFAPRVGPTVAQMQRIKETGPWLKDHAHALVWGLQHFDGVAVLEDVIREYCGRGGPLERYNVTEIAIKAAEWKERLLRIRTEKQLEVEDWIRRIPVWTDPHVLDEGETLGELEDE